MTAPPNARFKATFQGQIGVGQWACSQWFQAANPGVPSPSDMITIAGNIESAWNTRMGSPLGAVNCDQFHYQGMRLDYYAAGSLASAANAQISTHTFAGSTTEVSAASQCLVASIYSSTASRRGRGRLYLPATAPMPGGINGVGWDTTKVTNLCNAYRSFLDDVNGTTMPVPTLSVQAVVQSLTAGALYPVTTVLVDSRPDRQEHREKNQVFFRRTATV